MKLTYWFPTVLGESYMPNAYNEYKKLLPKIEKIKNKTEKCFYYYQIHKDKNFKKINNFVFKEVNEFSKQHNFGKIKFHDSWFNDYKKYDANTPHVHDGSVFTAVYFLVGHIDDTALVIHKPSPPDMMNPRKTTPIDPQKNINHLTAEDIVIKPSTGYLCIFRSFLLHEVPVKRNEHNRISLAYTFNVS